MAVKWANFHRGQNSAKSGMRYVKVGVNEDADSIFGINFDIFFFILLFTGPDFIPNQIHISHFTDTNPIHHTDTHNPTVSKS